MRAVTRHLLTAVVVGAAAAGVCVSVDHGLGTVHAEPAQPIAAEAVPATSAAPSASSSTRASVTTPGPSATELRSYESDRTSRSSERAPIGSNLVQQRDAVLADHQRKAAAQAQELLRADAERERREQLTRDGYDPETATTPREIGKQMAENLYGWSGSEWTCFDKLIISESNWKTTATNPSSGAYGIPQSLPASKLATAGSDWRTNPATQIKWGLKYIDDRYGTPCSAWSFKQGHNWY